MSDEDFAALNGDGPQGDIADISGTDTETVIEPLQTQADAPVADGQATAADAPQVEPEQKMVDIRALQEARAEIRKRDEELAKTRAEQIRIEERLNILNQAIAAQNKPQEQAPVVPSKDEDPLGYYEHQIQELNQRLSKVDQTEQQRQQQAQAEQQHTMLLKQASSYIDQAASENPQVSEALDYAFEGLRNEIQSDITRRGVPVTHQAMEYERLWKSSVATMAQRLLSNPQGAAEFIFRNARYYGWGYQPPQQQAQVQQPVVQQAPVVAQPTVQQRQEQQQRHQSLSGVTGAEPPKTLTAKELSSMSQKEYNELLKTVAGKKILEEQFGGY